MPGRVLTPLEVSAIRRDTDNADDIENLISTIEDAWTERNRYKRLIDDVWNKFGEMSKLIRSGMKG